MMDQDRPIVDENQIQRSREERRTTGRIVAVIVALSIIMLACYHAWIRKTAVLAGVIIPALIMVLYTAWVLYTAKRDKYRRNLELHGASLAEVLSMGPSSSSKKDSEADSGAAQAARAEKRQSISEDSQRHPPLERKGASGAPLRHAGKKKPHPRVVLAEIPRHSGGGVPGKAEDLDHKKSKDYNRSQSAA
ncbi:uncharacterized protein LOC129807365 [Phlebotomus papatasi]|uniref:uncharacterized protein LOC129807365 n=1 Tax=Phlebotomus papatasi TaxID=29031 RepID=UPI0024834A9C|nr:uncharacterized protein LOC129807365 [Phlebotomus papatasi]